MFGVKVEPKNVVATTQAAYLSLDISSHKSYIHTKTDKL